MNPINRIREKLKTYRQLEVIEDSVSITVKSDNSDGFDITFCDDNDEYTVYFEGWHQHFNKSECEDALNCFAFGLSESCRIKEFSRKGKAYKWVLESKEDGEWKSDSTTALLSFNLFRKPEVRYLQNKFINESDS